MALLYYRAKAQHLISTGVKLVVKIVLHYANSAVIQGNSPIFCESWELWFQNSAQDYPFINQKQQKVRDQFWLQLQQLQFVVDGVLASRGEFWLQSVVVPW